MFGVRILKWDCWIDQLSILKIGILVVYLLHVDSDHWLCHMDVKLLFSLRSSVVCFVLFLDSFHLFL